LPAGPRSLRSELAEDLLDAPRTGLGGLGLSSAPARLASIGGWAAVQRYYRPEFGLSLAKLRTSREARLALFLIYYRSLASLPWQPVDEHLLRDDGECARARSLAQLRLVA
jgi:hypothetical protein